MISFVSAFYEFNRRLRLLVTIRNETRGIWKRVHITLKRVTEGNSLSRSKDTDGCHACERMRRQPVVGSID